MEEQYLQRKQIVKDVIYSPEYKPLKYKELAFLLQVKEEENSMFGE